MSKSPAAATRRQVGKRSTHMLQEKVGVKSSESSSRKTLLEKDVLFDKETVIYSKVLLRYPFIHIF